MTNALRFTKIPGVARIEKQRGVVFAAAGHADPRTAPAAAAKANIPMVLVGLDLAIAIVDAAKGRIPPPPAVQPKTLQDLVAEARRTVIDARTKAEKAQLAEIRKAVLALESALGS